MQGRGDEGRGRLALALLLFDLGDQKPTFGDGQQPVPYPCRFLAVHDAELLLFLSFEDRELGDEGLLHLLGMGLDGPVLPGLEGLDLLLALDDHAQRRALHPAGGQPAPDLAPQERREVETHQVIQGPPRLLGIDEVHRQGARSLQGLGDRPARDLVEHHPIDRLVVQHLALAQDLRHMPGDGLAFTVEVGSEIQGLGGTHGAADGIHVFDVLFDQLIAHGETVVGVHRTLLGQEIAHMPVGGEHLVAGTEVAADGPGLGRGFDDQQVFGHVREG